MKATLIAYSKKLNPGKYQTLQEQDSQFERGPLPEEDECFGGSAGGAEESSSATCPGVPASSKGGVTDSLVEAIRGFLGEEGRSLFEKYHEDHGRVDPVFVDGGIPHPVHFREGMQVRNAMRTHPDCAGWTDEDFDGEWVEVVEKAIGIR